MSLGLKLPRACWSGGLCAAVCLLDRCAPRSGTLSINFLCLSWASGHDAVEATTVSRSDRDADARSTVYVEAEMEMRKAENADGPTLDRVFLRQGEF